MPITGSQVILHFGSPFKKKRQEFYRSYRYITKMQCNYVNRTIALHKKFVTVLRIFSASPASIPLKSISASAKSPFT